MSQKRQVSYHFSCDLCYRKKVKCDKANPCTNCVRHEVECIPSQVEGSEKTRKKRFPEAELLGRLKKYEAALRSYGADLEAIQEGGRVPSVKQESVADNDQNAESKMGNPGQEFEQLQGILEGKSSSGPKIIFKYYDKLCEDDGSSLFLAVDSSTTTPIHPPPFDIFKLWQLYCDNVHPLCKILHCPTFQRKISSFGNDLASAPAHDQALFFAMYTAAVSSMSGEECKATFSIEKEALLRQYQVGTQVWLRKANVWRTSNLIVLQALVLSLIFMQNTMDPRTLSCFLAMADRTARHMGLHRDNVRTVSSIEHEMQRRVWWELILLDSRTVEKVGIGTSILCTNWNVHLPSERSDADLDFVESLSPTKPFQPSSEMLFSLVRCEIALYLTSLRKQQGLQAGWTEFSNHRDSLAAKLQSIDDFEHHLQSRYFSFCNTALPQHRMTVLFAKNILSRMSISAYIYEEGNLKDVTQQADIRLKLFQACVTTMNDFTQLHMDPASFRHHWFVWQNLPFIAWVHMLRLLQIVDSSSLVEEAWKVIQTLLSGIDEARKHKPIYSKGMIFDSLVLRAWKVKRWSLYPLNVDPPFIQTIRARNTNPHESVAQSNGDLTNDANADLNLDDQLAMLAGVLEGADQDFDWSTWLNEPILS